MKSVACFSLLALAASFAHADDAALKKAIAARYAEMSKAFINKDVKTFEAGFAPDFKGKAFDGQPVSRAKILQDFETQMKTLSDVKWSQTITSLKSAGKVVHVTIDSLLTASMPGEGGSTHSFKLITKGTKSDWVKNGKLWQVKSSESKDVKMWFDGKPVAR